MTHDKPKSRNPLRIEPHPANVGESELKLLPAPLRAAWLELATPEPGVRARLWNELARSARAGTVSSTVARVDRAMALRATGAQLGHGMLLKAAVGVALLSGALALVLYPRFHSARGGATAAPPPAASNSAAGESATPLPAGAASKSAAVAAPAQVVAEPHAPRVVPSEPTPHTRRTPFRVRSAPPEPIVVAPPAPSSAPPVAAPIVPAPARLDLASELKLLRSASLALAAHDPASAQRLLDRHDVLYPKSVLAKEKRALRIIAACALGQPQAHHERDSFLLSEPNSPLGARVREACPGSTGSN